MASLASAVVPVSRALDSVADRLRDLRASPLLSPAAQEVRRSARRGGHPVHQSNAPHLRAAVEWLGRAQDATGSGGIARGYSLTWSTYFRQAGWQPAYPETTGYIIPSLIECARFLKDKALTLRAKRALDWLLSIQLPNGAFQGGRIGLHPVLPVVFNTGQILLGLASGVAEFGVQYLEPMRRAATWLVENQDTDGAWRKYHSPFASPDEKSYETHVAWGLLEAARVDPNQRYVDAALRNARWALTQQASNGWFSRCSFDRDDTTPLTHTIGYTLRGILEAYRYSRDDSLLKAARRTSDGLLSIMGEDGFIPACLTSRWEAASLSACLTGTAQIAICLLLLYEFTSDLRYRDAAFAANRYVRRNVRLTGPPEIRGGVKGSFPIHAEYCPYQFINWGNKFVIDANLLELKVNGCGSITRPTKTLASS